mmetsp:Transcript_22961/g.39310  ORF Transcript_22961/g.39310 Transcript_22961/m.39310 type:complete len:292 (+) Transcript_22961:97-972(+)|eukprot:CAMPEP_0183703722 /NCGR_PEP_ID=MMETSP0737-20130205/1359_1 /TAXON_ID=385413 /ORGANISM="Thalassiosira miniscula, Strain CCMP1093" /LENGTH=291 /DNA_ID=CAMNT_0025930519 /DNA_START=47 /DNA_END=922 /DNA_ORIENTATION=+
MGKKRQPRKDESESDDSGSLSSNHDRAESVEDVPLHEQSDEDDADINDASLNSKEQDDEDADKEPKQSKKQKKVRKLKLSATQDFNAKLQKRGIVYLSRVPPRMGPAKVKTLLADFGTITRVYLVEEDKTVRKKRRKAGGSGGKRYTEGWVEFESKKVAKLVGETLNMSRVTNHKGSIHYDDLWNIKYLRGFKWSHLTEKVAYERRVREQKLRVEMMEVRRENASYIAQVEAGKKMDYIEERRKKRQQKEGVASGAENDAGMAKKKRKIRQKKPFDGDRSSTKSAILGSLV